MKLLLLLPFVLLYHFVSFQSLSTTAWHMLVIFIGTIVAIMLNITSMSVIALFGLTTAVLTNTLSINKALSGFASPVVWLVVVAVFIAKGVIKTGLGKRIGYFFISKLGSTNLGLGYGVVLTELLL